MPMAMRYVRYTPTDTTLPNALAMGRLAIVSANPAFAPVM